MAVALLEFEFEFDTSGPGVGASVPGGGGRVDVSARDSGASGSGGVDEPWLGRYDSDLGFLAILVESAKHNSSLFSCFALSLCAKHLTLV